MNRFALLFLLPITISTGVSAMSKKHAANQEPHDSVWVAKTDQGKSCESEPGIESDTMGGELQKAQVKILAKKKIYDSKPRIQMCGADRGNMNGFLIPSKDLPKALTLGFKQVSGQ